MSPRPCRGGAGVGSASLIEHRIFYITLPFSLISLTPPLSPPLQGRGNSAYGILQNTISFWGARMYIVPFYFS